jgi:crotonobetainyl-CoA:carnitine CoA-transferase CaiB-like acyl-CoA transferase
MQPLAGVRVLEITEVLAGPFCGMLLGDMGADVIKIERPGVGDATRAQGPFAQNGMSFAFTMVNRNKRSLTLNLKDPRAQAVARRIAGEVDIVLENFRPGVMASVGLGYEELRAHNPGLIYCSISGFGQTGPYRDLGGFDLVAQGMCGLMSVTGEPDGMPCKAGFPVTDLGTALYAAYGIMAALHHRERTGEGQLVDTSLFECGVSWSIWHVARYLGTGVTPGAQGSGHPLSAPYQAFATADGHIIVGAGSQPLWARFCRVLGAAELRDDPRFDTVAKRAQHLSELVAALQPYFRRHTTAEWRALFDEAGIPCGPINTIPQMLEDPQARARNMILEYDHPVAGPIKNIGSAVKLSATPPGMRMPPPSLGQHNEEVLAGLGMSVAEIVALREDGVI